MLKNLILQLGNTIRYYDEGQHSEHRTQDGDYISGYHDTPRVSKATF